MESDGATLEGKTEQLVGSFAYFANSLAVGLGLRLDPALLGYLAHDRDVGWYTSSWSLAQISLLLVPVLGPVLMPLLARARSRSREEMQDVMRRVLESLVALTTPVALLPIWFCTFCRPSGPPNAT